MLMTKLNLNYIFCIPYTYAFVIVLEVVSSKTTLPGFNYTTVYFSSSIPLAVLGGGCVVSVPIQGPVIW